MIVSEEKSVGFGLSNDQTFKLGFFLLILRAYPDVSDARASGDQLSFMSPYSICNIGADSNQKKQFRRLAPSHLTSCAYNKATQEASCENRTVIILKRGKGFPIL